MTADWFPFNTALCMGVCPCLVLKSKWAPPLTRLMITSRHFSLVKLVAKVSGVSVKKIGTKNIREGLQKHQGQKVNSLLSNFIINKHFSSTYSFPLSSVFDFFIVFFNPFPNNPWFLRVCSASLLKTLWEKVKLLVMSNFFSHSVFYSFGELSAVFIKFEIVVCKPFKFGRV